MSKSHNQMVHRSSRQAGLCRGDWCLIKPHWFCHCRGVCSHWLWHFAVFGLPCEWPVLALPRCPLGFLGSLIAFLSVAMLEMKSVLRSGPIVAHHPKWTAQSSTPGAIQHYCDFNGCRGFLPQPQILECVLLWQTWYCFRQCLLAMYANATFFMDTSSSP